MKQKSGRKPIVHLEMLQNQEKEHMNEIRKGLIVTTKLKKEVDAYIYTRNPKLSELPPVLETY